MAKNINENKRKEKLRNNNKIRFLDIKNDSIKINMIENIVFDINFFSIFIISILIIIDFCNLIKTNGIYFQYSKISLKIRGKSKNVIFIMGEKFYFEGINYLKEVYINGNKSDKIDYKYSFN